MIASISAHDPRWRSYVSGAPHSLFSGDRWQGVIQRSYGFEPMVLVPRGDLDGGLPYALACDHRGTRRIAYPFSDVCEPLGSCWPAIEAHLAASSVPFAVRSRLPVSELARRAHVVGAHHTVTIDDGWRGRIAHRHARNIRKAEESGVTTTIATDLASMREFYRLHSELRMRKFKLLPQGFTFMQQIHETFVEPGLGFVILAAWQERIVGAAVCLIEDRTLYYKFGASDGGALAARPNHALFARMFEEAQRLGLGHVDLGISLDEKRTEFKANFGGTSVPLTRLEYGDPVPGDPAMDAALKSLTELLTRDETPAAVAQEAGEILYRFFV